MRVNDKAIMEYMYMVGKKLTKEELRKKLGVSGESDVDFFNSQITVLEESGQLYLDDDGFYHIFDDHLVYSYGKIFISQRGDGYVRVSSDGTTKNYMIRNKDLNGALPNDYVLISGGEKGYYGHQFAEVVKILKRNSFKELFKYMGDGLFSLYGVRSNVNFMVNKRESDKLGIGALVLASVGNKVVSIDDGKIFFDGNVEKVAGHCDDPKAQIIALGYKYGFDHNFSKKVYSIVETLPSFVSENELDGRCDLRGEKIFTIDGADTKDIDDAVSITKKDGHYIVKVSIADVSYYVKDHPELVEEAIRRGNSAYLADSVFPMLPHSMSNGICSLNPGEDRLAKTVEMIFDEDGRVVSSTVYRSVINSKKQMRYEDVNRIFAGEHVDGYESFENELMLMRKLSRKISKNRNHKGSLVFGSRENKIKTDGSGEALDFKKSVPGEAEKIIENFMIAANIEFIDNFAYLGYPFIYRVHEEPDKTKLKATLLILKEQGLCTSAAVDELLKIIELDKKIRPQNLFPILNSIKDETYYEAVSTLLLRSMKKAFYSPCEIGHFGLAEDSYAHLTSPIRRCSDLINHIVMDYAIDLNQHADDAVQSAMILSKLDEIQKHILGICEQISEREVAADDAEREVEKLMQVQYFISNIRDFEGPISARIQAMNKLGMTVMVDDLITAKVDAVDLADNGYSYMQESHTFVDSAKKEKFTLGDDVYVFDPEPSIEMKRIEYHSIGHRPEDIMDIQKQRVYRKSVKL